MCAQIIHLHDYDVSVCVHISVGVFLLYLYGMLEKPRIQPILDVATKLPTPMADILQLLAHFSEFSPSLLVLLQHLTHSLFASTPSHLHGCQSLLVIGKDNMQCPHQD